MGRENENTSKELISTQKEGIWSRLKGIVHKIFKRQNGTSEEINDKDNNNDNRVLPDDGNEYRNNMYSADNVRKIKQHLDKVNKAYDRGADWIFILWKARKMNFEFNCNNFIKAYDEGNLDGLSVDSVAKKLSADEYFMRTLEDFEDDLNREEHGEIVNEKSIINDKSILRDRISDTESGEDFFECFKGILSQNAELGNIINDYYKEKEVFLQNGGTIEEFHGKKQEELMKVPTYDDLYNKITGREGTVGDNEIGNRE